MSTYTSEWAAAGRRASERAAAALHKCGTPMVVGYSNLGVPVPACPKCHPYLIANGRRAIGDVWGCAE